MKNKSYIGISFVILVFGIWAVPNIIARFEKDEVIENDRLNITTNDESLKSDLLVVGKAPEFSLTNQHGETITQDFYKDKVYVVEFFFSTCPSICPVMNRNLLEIDKKFASHKNFGIASITINPENDTPAVLKEHADMLGVTSENWNFLTGDKDYIFNIANKGFKIFAGENKQAAGGFEHSGLFALIDKQGRIRCRRDKSGNPIGYYTGLNYNDKEGMQEDLDGKFKPGVVAIKEDIKKLLEE